MGSGSKELLRSFEQATAELNICPNRVWTVAREDLMKLLPDDCRPMPATKPKHGKGEKDTGLKHESCTFDFCEDSQRDFTAVNQRHECEEENCLPLRGRFSRTILDAAAGNGESTVWTFAGNSMLKAPRPYMALSHIWSDGTGAGAWGEGQVNECLYAYFQDIATQFQCEGIWWDTICIPSGKSARSKAIRKIQGNYEDARITLVHDCFLRDWEWNPETACFGILMSTWFSRGWTALELAYSRKVKVIFKGPHGPVIKDLDEEILAKDGDGSDPRRQEASRIILHLRKNIENVNDLLTILGSRYTSWPKDMATISALLTKVAPKTLQQDTYQEILMKIGRISPGHLFHNSATMSKRFTWCPTSLFSMPLESDASSLKISAQGNVHGRWRLSSVGENLDESCLWNKSHPLIRRHLQDALVYSNGCWLLAEFDTGPVERALLVREIESKQGKGMRCEYVGALYFYKGLLDYKWEEREVVISGYSVGKEVNSDLTRNGSREQTSAGLEEEKSDTLILLHQAVWRRDRTEFDRLIKVVNDPDVGDKLAQRPLHLAAERGDIYMVECLLDKSDLESRCSKGQTALHRAAWAGSIAVVELLLRKNSDVTAKDNEGNTALHIAAKMRFEPVVRLLIDEETVNDEGHKNMTPLHYATMNGDEATSRLLVASGASVKVEDKTGWTPLHCAASSGSKEAVTLLVEQGANVNAKDSKFGWTPLHCAAESGNKDNIMILLREGANVNAKDYKVGWTPLYVAAMNGLGEVVDLLAEKGGIKEAKDKFGWTPRRLADINGHSDKVNLLPDKAKVANPALDYKWTPLHCLAVDSQGGSHKLLANRRADRYWKDGKNSTCMPLLYSTVHGLGTALHRLLGKDYNIEEKSQDGRTLLSLAATTGQDATIRRLLEEGADKESRDNLGRTPLYWAARHGHDSTTKLLIESGADLNTHNDYGRMPLISAARGAFKEMVEVLIRNGADVNAKDVNGLTPLMWAAQFKSQGIPTMQVLIDNGAKLEARDDTGLTALLFAARNSFAQVAEALLANKADMNATDNRGKNMLIWAAAKGNESLIKRLLERAMDMEKKDNAGTTPLWWAVRHKRLVAAKFLIARGADATVKDDEGVTILMLAAESGNLALTELVMTMDANVEARDSIGRTPLMWAAGNETEDVAALLIAKGADTMARDNNGRTVLMWAAKNKNNNHVAELLLKHGTELDGKDLHGWTPLGWAIWNRNLVLVELLLKRGADMESRDENGWTALRWTGRNGGDGIQELVHKRSNPYPVVETRKNEQKDWKERNKVNRAIAQLLFENGADIEAEDTQERSPLVWAAWNRNLEMVDMLLERGAAMESRDEYGWSAQRWAVSNRDLDMAKLLHEKGASVGAMDMKGVTPMRWAFNNGDVDMVEVLGGLGKGTRERWMKADELKADELKADGLKAGRCL